MYNSLLCAMRCKSVKANASSIQYNQTNWELGYMWEKTEILLGGINVMQLTLIKGFLPLLLTRTKPKQSALKFIPCRLRGMNVFHLTHDP